MVSNTDTIWFYPATNNTGAMRQSVITFTNSYGDTDTITLTQEAPLLPPIVSVLKVNGDPMTLTDATGTLALGSRTIALTFTPSGVTGIVRWRAEFNSAIVGLGTLIVIDYVENFKTIDILVDVPSNETVYVYLSSDVLNDNTASSGLIELTIQALQPIATVTYISASNTDMSWLATESSFLDAIPSVISTPILNAYVHSMPNWITIKDDLGQYVYVGSPLETEIQDGHTIYIYPTVDNLANDLTGEIVLINDYGDTETILLFHAAAIPSGVVLVATLVVDTVVDWTGMTISGTDVYAVSGNTNINITFRPTHPWYGNNEGFTMYSRVYVNDVLYGSSTFVAYNEIENEAILPLSSYLLATDVVVIKLSSMIF
jgi:hypothetical protein